MILVKIIGGLGNQMFQYAAGRYLSLLHGAELKLDLFDYEKDITEKREFVLDKFNINARIANRDEVARFKGASRDMFARYFPRVYRILGLYKTTRIRTETPGMILVDLPDNVYLDGFWQTVRYCEQIKQILVSELTIKTKPGKKDLEILKQIRGTNSVAIHIRRGDYVHSKYTHVYYNLPLAYYLKAIQILAKKIKDPWFYIFSDDAKWVRENIKIGHYVTYVDHNPPSMGYQDLRLFSRCQHAVIANSTYSWWGAWLNNNPNKIIIGSKKWYRDPLRGQISIYPKEWIIT